MIKNYVIVIAVAVVWTLLGIWTFFLDNWGTKNNIETNTIYSYQQTVDISNKIIDFIPTKELGTVKSATVAKIDFKKIFAYQDVYSKIPELQCSIPTREVDLRRNYIIDLSTYTINALYKAQMERQRKLQQQRAKLRRKKLRQQQLKQKATIKGTQR